MDFKAVRESLRGPGALVSSIFNDDLSLNPGAIENNVRAAMKRGFGSNDGFFVAPCGDGEYVTLSPDENGQVVTAVRKGSDGKLPIIAGVNSPDIRYAIRTAEEARKAGAVAVMMAPPSYYPLNREAILDWYKRFADAVDIGIMLYDQGFRGPAINSGVGSSLMEDLLKIPSVVATKHIGLFALADEFTILHHWADKIAYIDSSAGYARTAGFMHGATGWVTEIANFWPEFEMKYYELVQAKKYYEAEMWHSKLAPLFEFVFSHPATSTPYQWINIAKVCLEYVGLTGGPVRPPFRALTAEERKPIIEILKSIGVPKG
jgi:4-hydroxy-tetrahydrodipicolinate synthase